MFINKAEFSGIPHMLKERKRSGRASLHFFLHTYPVPWVESVSESHAQRPILLSSIYPVPKSVFLPLDGSYHLPVVQIAHGLLRKKEIVLNNLWCYLMFIWEGITYYLATPFLAEERLLSNLPLFIKNKTSHSWNGTPVHCTGTNSRSSCNVWPIISPNRFTWSNANILAPLPIGEVVSTKCPLCKQTNKKC